MVTGKPIQVVNIRSNRDKPGLLRQHLSAVRAATEVGKAIVEGDEIGSEQLTFTPKTIQAGNYSFAVGTAGSATLVLQTVLPALMLAEGPSEVLVEGGTHNQWAPPYEFLAKAYLPLIRKIGPNVTAGFERYGFYPAGGGRFSVAIEPTSKALKGLQLIERREITQHAVTAVVASLSRAIGQREIDTVAKKLPWPPHCFHVCETPDSLGPGNVVLIEIDTESVNEVFVGFGRINASAEKVAYEAIKQAKAYLAADVPVGKYLADQIMLPLAIAAWKDGERSQFRTFPLSRHSTTHIEILQKFFDVPISVEKEERACAVIIG